MATSFRHKIIDGSASGEILIELQMPSAETRRLVWCSFYHSAFSAGDEAWLKFYSENIEVLALPMQLGITTTQNIWLADSPTYRGGVARTQINFTMVWNNSGGGGYCGIQPMPLTLEADRVILTQTAGAGTIQALLAVLSQSP